MQLLAARIVSGLPIFASKTSLYYEAGWIPLFIRRKIARLKDMYKVDKNVIPSYIRDIFPDRLLYCMANASSKDIQRGILKTILYQNVAYSCTKLLLFQLLLGNGTIFHKI